jgi:hypothetical protein
MRRPLAALAALSMFSFASRADADELSRLTVKARLKTETAGKKSLSFLFAEGKAPYPDGTTLRVGLVSPGGGAWLAGGNAEVRHEEWLLEHGPIEKHVPPGRYRVFVEFRLDKQNEAIQAEIRRREEFGRCLDKDPATLKKAMDTNPEWTRRVLDWLEKTGKCFSERQATGCDLVVGSDEEASRATDVEREDLRGRIELARDLLVRLASADAETPFDEWLDEWRQIETQVRRQRLACIYSAFSSGWERLDAAVLSLSWLADETRWRVAGEGAQLRAEADRVAALGDQASRDEKRATAAALARLAGIAESERSHTTAAATALAGALHGEGGVEPSPALFRKFVDDLTDDLGLKEKP